MLLGVSGGIAAYKAAELTRRLRDAGAEVRVVLTENAARFVTPLTFQALSGQPVRSGLWDEAAEAAMGHIELARWAQRILIAPASADLIARLAHGFADDLLTTLCLASAAPVAIAPAMNQQMWAHPATQANVATLRARGVDRARSRRRQPGLRRIRSGPAARSRRDRCRDRGAARAEAAVRAARAGQRRADATRTSIRCASSATAVPGAWALPSPGPRPSRARSVQLVAGPVHLPTPAGVERNDVRSARDMRAAVMQHIPQSDIFISAAAVGDYRPGEIATHKLKKQRLRR